MFRGAIAAGSRKSSVNEFVTVGPATENARLQKRAAANAWSRKLTTPGRFGEEICCAACRHNRREMGTVWPSAEQYEVGIPVLLENATLMRSKVVSS